MKFKIPALTVLMFFCSQLCGQYLINFQPGDGTTGPFVGDLSTCGCNGSNYTLSGVVNLATNPLDYFTVQSSTAYMEGRDTDGEACVNGSTPVGSGGDLVVTVESVGTMESSDYAQLSYWVDGGPITTDQKAGNITMPTWTISIPSGGTTLFFQVCVRNNNDAEAHRIHSVTYDGVALPVELIEFKGKVVSSAIQLDWITASEFNNAFFELERSTDGRNFQPIGVIDGSGNSNELRNYSFKDLTPFIGVNYYRIRQVDLDGSYEYSKVISVLFIGKGGLRAYPNPVKDILLVEWSKEFTYVNVFSLNGELIFAKEINRGTNQIDVSKLPKGQYILAEENSGEMIRFQKE